MLLDLFAGTPLSTEQKQALQQLEAELTASRAQMQRLETKIAGLEAEIAGEHSVLTRPEFNREVARMLAFDERYGGNSSILYFDLAGLDTVATQFGQPVAVEAARTTALILMKHLRSSDIVGRLAGEEFGVLLVRCNNENAWKKGRELAALLLLELDSVGGRKLGLDISFGAYTFREEEDVGAGLKQAAEALTKAEKA